MEKKDFKINYFLEILIFIWEFPQRLIFFIIYLFVRKKILVVTPFYRAKVFFIKGFPGGISLGRYIILDAKYLDDEHLLKHEYGHSIQSIILGWLYPLIIGIPSLTRSIMWRVFKKENSYYYRAFPENWAERLGNRIS